MKMISFVKIYILILFFSLTNKNSFSFEQYNSVYISKAQKSVDVLHYYLKIDLNSESKSIIGSATIKVLKPLKQNFVELNFSDNLTVKNISSDEKLLHYSHKNNRIKIDIPDFNSDTVSFTINYNGNPKRVGFGGMVFGEINNIPLIYTINQPEFASSWFPCDDDPDDKALLDIEITNDSQFVSMSNGKLINVIKSGNKKTYYWKTLYPISTNLIAVYSSLYVSFKEEYRSINNKILPLEFYVLPEHLEMAKKDFAEHQEMLRVFENLFGEYPFINEKYAVAEFLWNFGAMENQTITGIGYNFISGRNFYRDILVHELAHSWWGNAVGIKSWKDIWLNESFASYCEALYLEYKFGKSSLRAAMQSKFNENFSGKLYNPQNLFGQLVYHKGAWVLHMLRYELGDSIFFSILKNYFEKYKFKTVSTEDFKSVCESFSRRNLNKFFEDWVFNDKGIIKCEFDFINDDEKHIIIINQISERFKAFNFNLDVQIIYTDNSTELKTFRIEKEKNRFDFHIAKEVKEIIPDPEEKLLAVFRKTNEQ